MLAAVVVTYNRKKVLAENIESMLNQTRIPDKIFVVDNCSTDGTKEFLAEKGWLAEERFVYICTESNIGGAGGFYTGTKAAYDAGANWILLMDDDGKAADENTVSKLMETAEMLYAAGEPKLFVNSLVQQGEMLSFKMSSMYTVEEALNTDCFTAKQIPSMELLSAVNWWRLSVIPIRIFLSKATRSILSSVLLMPVLKC